MRPPRIEIRNLAFGYPGRRPLFSHLSLAIEPGQALGIIGPNGCGKSTLLRLLAGLLPGHGAIEVGGEPLSSRRLPAWRSRIGMVFQDSAVQLFMPTVLEDVAAGLLNHGRPPGEAAAAARRMLGQLEIEHLADLAPHQLSGGEKRRAALAGVLVMQPAVLLLDEPSLNLDPRARRGLIELLNDLPSRVARPLTRIVTSHDLDFVWDCCDQVALLHGGHIAAHGDPDQLLRNEQLLEEHGLERPLSLLARPRLLRHAETETAAEEQHRACI